MGNHFSRWFIYANDITLVAHSADALNVEGFVSFMQRNLHLTQIKLNVGTS